MIILLLGGCTDETEPLEEPTSVLLDLDRTDGFFSFPWPSDARLTAEGAPDYSDFPVQNAGNLVDVYRIAAGELLTGFGTNPRIHVRFDGELAPWNWPPEPTTMDIASPVLLMNVDAGSPEYGSLTPVKLHWQADDDVYADPNMLTALPSVGFPLLPATPYALVILDSLGDVSGRPLDVPEVLQSAMLGVGKAQLTSAYEPLGPALDARGIPRTSVAAATVFTTNDPVAELRAMRDWLVDTNHIALPELLDFDAMPSFEEAGYPFRAYGGAYETPIFQRGAPPYGSEGGGFEFEGEVPVVQRWESVNFVLTVPLGEPPEDGYPLVIALPGTGGSIYDHLTEEAVRTMGELLSEESRLVATFGFEPPLHGSRGVGAQPDLHTFNYFNPESSRCVLRQEALDASFAVRLLRETLVPEHPELSLAPEHIGFFGHSQGAHIGAMLAAVEPEIDPVYINAMGGGLAYTLLERTDPFDIEEMIRLAIGETSELSVFHPVVGLAQSLSEVVDPINYGPEWFGRSAEGEATSVLLSAGFLDQYTPYVTVNGLTVASGLPPIEPVEWGIGEAAWVGLESVEMPLAGNVIAADGEAITAGLITRGNLGHFVVQECYYTARTGADFLATGLHDGLPEVH